VDLAGTGHRFVFAELSPASCATRRPEHAEHRQIVAEIAFGRVTAMLGHEVEHRGVVAGFEPFDDLAVSSRSLWRSNMEVRISGLGVRGYMNPCSSAIAET